MKKLLVIAMVAVVAFSAQATLILNETFSHPYDGANGVLIGRTPNFGGSTWATNGTGVGIKTNVVAGSLTAPSGFAASTGNSVMYGKDTALTGKEMHTRFTPTTVGSVLYYSFLINLNAISSGKGASIISLSFDSGAEYASLFATNTVGNSYVTLGLGGKSTASGVWSATQFATNTTHLVVVSYQNISGTGNDIMKMWLDPTSFGGVEPAYDLTMTGVSETASGVLNTLELKNTTSIPRVIVDELRVGTTWADVTPIPEPATVGMLGLGALVTMLIRRIRRN
jgi:hypothetical protein